MGAAQGQRGFGGAACEWSFEPGGGDSESRRWLRGRVVEKHLEHTLGEQRRERARTHDAASAQHQDPAGDTLQRAQVAGREQHGHARRGEVRHPRAKVAARKRIEPRERLVEQKYPAPAERRLREGETVQIGATKRCCARSRGRGEPSELERVVYQRVPRDAGGVESGVVAQPLVDGERRRGIPPARMS